MKKLFCSSLVALLSLLTFLIPSASAEEVDKSAQSFAEGNFVNIVLDHVRSEEYMNYNLSKSEKISFGKLYQVYRMSDDFVTTKKALAADKGFVKSDEYVAAVYQDGKPVNAIGTTKDDKGNYVLSSFGYGQDLAVALDNKKSNGGKVFYELPADAWYIFENGRVEGFSKNATLMLGTQLSLPEFRNYIHDKYSNQKEIIEFGEQTGVGGDYSTPYTPDENKGNSNVVYGAIFSSALLLVFVGYKNRSKFIK
ncbi:hypothetical protein LCM00_21250 [Bacillus infantis]|uniref:hypothetical protein n=1 Tax=Bacillus infantis TaxID=324767 RepID=UPI001CD6BB9F|nr:hypothetical protein [Bacillus infantis]MCA1042028.1 hypothetical protein [Bacillus infantis]